MQTYTYTKDIPSDVLTEAISLRTSLRSVFVKCSTSKFADGTIPDDNIVLSFSRVLLSEEQDEIANLINIINPSYDLWARKNIENNTMRWAMSIGQSILAQFSSNNLYAQKTEEQIDALVENYPHLIHSLMTGSLKKAYKEFMTMQPDENITEIELNEFRLRMKIILGIP